MTNADKIKLMRSHAVMAGITSLSQQYPQHVPLEARPSPAALYLYDSILLAGKNNVHAAFAGLRRFVIVLLDDIDQGRRCRPEAVFLPLTTIKRWHQSETNSLKAKQAKLNYFCSCLNGTTRVENPMTFSQPTTCEEMWFK